MSKPWFGRKARAVESLSDEPSQHSDSSQDEVIDIKGDQFSNKTDEVSTLNLTSMDMVALGLTTAIGGHYFAWNAGLSIGFGGFVIALFLIASAYYNLVLCIAELSSALPFAGGAYGIARVTLGIFPGCLVAVCDSFKSIIYGCTAAYSVGNMITVVTLKDTVNEFGYWFAFYIGCLAVHLYGGKFFWRVNKALAVLSVLILFIYIFGAIKFAHFVENAVYPGEHGIGQWFHGDTYQFVQVLPLATRFFQGIQSINLACGQIKNPKKEVPKGYIGSMTFVIFTSFAVLFLATAVKPGLKVFIVRLRPLSSGFKQMFALPRYRAPILSIPATIMSGFGFMYYYGQQLSAMGKSGMLNPVFGNELPGRNTPYVSLIVGSALGYMLCVIEWYYPDTQDQIYSLSILGAVTTYLSIFASFIMFRWYFPTIKREFVNPLGTTGAIYGTLVFALCFVSVCGFQKDQMAIIVYAIIMAVASIYYYFVVRKRQVFSEEEKTVMFKAYLMKNNAAKADRIRKGPRNGPGAGAGAGARVGDTPKQSDKKSILMTNKVDVAPLNTNIAIVGSGGRAAASGGQTPTSTTVMLPYRAADGAPTSGLFDLVPTVATSPEAGAGASTGTGSTENIEEGLEGVRGAYSERQGEGDIESGEMSGARCPSVAPGASSATGTAGVQEGGSDPLARKEESNRLVTMQE